MGDEHELVRCKRKLSALTKKIARLENKKMDPYKALLHPPPSSTLTTRNGPVLTPRITKHKRMYSKEDKEKIVTFLDELPDTQRKDILNGHRPNQYTTPAQLRKWYSKHKKGEKPTNYGPPLAVKPELFLETVASVRERCAKKKAMSMQEFVGHLDEAYQATHHTKKRMSKTTKNNIKKILIEEGYSITKHQLGDPIQVHGDSSSIQPTL